MGMMIPLLGGFIGSRLGRVLPGGDPAKDVVKAIVILAAVAVVALFCGIVGLKLNSLLQSRAK